MGLWVPQVNYRTCNVYITSHDSMLTPGPQTVQITYFIHIQHHIFTLFISEEPGIVFAFTNYMLKRFKHNQSLESYVTYKNTSVTRILLPAPQMGFRAFLRAYYDS